MDTLIKNFIFSPKWLVIRHLCFWILMYLDELFSFIGFTEPYEMPILLIPEFALDICTVYVNIYILIPQLLNKHKYALYAGLTFLTVAINAWLILYIDSLYFEYEDGIGPVFINGFISTLGVLGIAIGLKLMKNQVLQSEHNELLNREKTEVELQNLRDQVNPHFLFNVLNTIYVQTQLDAAQAGESIMILSDLLRYQIYGTSQQKLVAVRDELDFLKNYIALEELRREHLSIEWDIDLQHKKPQIAPFILLPLVENAIKHSKMIDGSTEQINLSCRLIRSNLIFKCTNTIGNLKPPAGGQGLVNLKKRLQLIYPNRHDLRLEEKDGIFIAYLSLSTDEIYHN